MSDQQSDMQSWSLDHITNVGHTLTETAARMPDAIAVASPIKPKSNSNQFERITFGQLETQSNQFALGIQKMGIQPGTRVALMVPPGIEFVKCVFGLFKAGVVVILIDPGMGKKNMIQCLSDAKPEGIVGIPLAHVARLIYRRKFPLCKKNVVVGRFPGCKKSSAFEKLNESQFSPVEITRENEAAIIFTTGSTGPPKGVLYRHRIFIEQARQVRDYFNIQPGSTDVSGFPLFALFNTAMGTTTIFPDMDPTRPASVHPPNIIEAIRQFNADQSFGSPALWNTVSKYCIEHSVTFPDMKRILSAGAPVPPDLLKRIKSIIHPDGDAFTPYGATESLPIACNSASVVIGETAEKTARGEGTCVGHRFPDINWRLTKVTDEPINSIDQCEHVPAGEIGELMVKGAVVTDQYVTQTDANKNHKVIDGDSSWHRMGDVGYFDGQERFWFCGRKSHRVITAEGTMFTIPIEGIINTHPSIYRSALVGVGEQGKQIPVLIVEPLPEHFPGSDSAKTTLLNEIKELASQHWQTSEIKHFMVHQSLPVDIRHNSKIFREQLRGWAAERLN